MKRLLFAILVTMLTLVACGGEPAQPAEIEVTRIVPRTIEVTHIVPQTVIALQTVEVTRVAQVVVTATPRPATPTVKPSATPEQPTGEDMFALNYLDEQERGGIKVEILRVLVGDKEITGKHMGGAFDEIEGFEGKPVVAEIIFRVTNTTDEVLTVYPDQATVVVSNEQIDLSEYIFSASVGDDVGGEIFPGVTAVGGLWFGIKRQAVPDIKSMIIAFSGPVDKSYNRRGDDFSFNLDLSTHEWQPMPDELK